MSADCSETQLVMDKMGAKSAPEPERELSEEEIAKVSERVGSDRKPKPERALETGAWWWWH